MPGLICEYIWLDKWNKLRSKTKVLHNWNLQDKGMPMWNYDGSSTGQAQGNDSEIFIKPVKIVPDPFRQHPNALLVLCDNWIIDKEESNNETVYKPHPGNTRYKTHQLFKNNHVNEENPWFGFEQEFFFTKFTQHPTCGFYQDIPLGMHTLDGKEWVALSGETQQKYYCGTGSKYVFGRKLADEVVMRLLYSNITCTGLNFEVAPGQCEFQIFGENIDAADSLILFRYILQRSAEEYEYDINYHPKPMEGDWNGSGCHTNFSTKTIRNNNSWDTIEQYISCLKENHNIHIENYGADNKKRLTGKHETASWEKFTSGIADRGASIRIPSQTFYNKSGYIEDRRPSSNCDPYVVMYHLINTTLKPQKHPNQQAIV